MRFLVTAGPTREYLDPVRFITNGSTGQMGYACAEAALKRNHKVVLISGPVSLIRPTGAKLIKVVTSQEMADAVAGEFESCDCLIMTAAICDYRPRQIAKYKMQKAATEGFRLELERTSDILAEIGQVKTHQVLVGFAVQDRAARRNARQKMKNKNLDMVVLNGPEAFGTTKSEVSILCRGGKWQICGMMTKKASGKIIVRQTEKLFLTKT